MEVLIKKTAIRLVLGDITTVPTDVLVNAANSELVGGGGVDGAIHRAGGPSLMLELNRVRPRGGCPAGSAVVTKAGSLPAKFVVHAVGPVWRGGGFREPELLASAYAESLKIATGLKAARITFPSISTGVYGYPVDKAAAAALAEIERYLAANETTLRELTFVLFDKETRAAYERALKALEARQPR